MEKFFVNIEDYNIKPYSNSGFSGLLYIGTSKKNKRKFIIKHKEVRFACCEFVFSRIGCLLKAKLPEAYFVRHDNCNKFISPYAVAIEYMENLKPFQTDKRKEKQIEQYIKINVLHVMFAQFDTIQIRMLPNGDVTSYDFADSFFLPDNISDVDSERTVDACALNFGKFKNGYNLGSMLSGLVEFFTKKFGEKTEIPYEEVIKNTLVGMLNLSDEQLEPIISAIEEYYGLNISVYIEEYIAVLKEKIRALL